MAKVFPEIDDAQRAFISAQQMFFVGTAPLQGDGHVNLSPKGLESFRILGPRSVAYLDYVGSGAETIAHLRENGRIVVMMCAFHGPPRILRLHGRGEVVEPPDPGFAELRALFPQEPRGRAVIRIAVNRIADSCGYAVPRYQYEGQRTQLGDWCDRKGEDGLAAYQREKNVKSLDGLPALRWPEQ
jgi:hypothetical protein